MVLRPPPGSDGYGAEPAPPAAERSHASLLRRIIARVAASPADLNAEELRRELRVPGARPIAECPDRERVCVAGVLRTVTFRPRGGTPALEADLWDGTGSVAVVWLGRREIGGIQPGRHIKLRGRITRLGGHRAIYNPIYELLASAVE